MSSAAAGHNLTTGGEATGGWRGGALLVGGAGLVVLALLLGWRPWRAAPAPRPDGDPVAIARYAATDGFGRLSEAERRPYLEAMRSSSTVIARARDRGALTKAEYDVARQNVWLVKKLEEVEQYFALPAGPRRVQHVDRLVRADEARRARAGAAAAADELGLEAFLRARRSAWPEELNRRFGEYSAAMRDRRQQLKGVRASSRVAP